MPGVASLWLVDLEDLSVHVIDVTSGLGILFATDNRRENSTKGCWGGGWDTLHRRHGLTSTICGAVSSNLTPLQYRAAGVGERRILNEESALLDECIASEQTYMWERNGFCLLALPI